MEEYWDIPELEDYIIADKYTREENAGRFITIHRTTWKKGWINWRIKDGCMHSWYSKDYTDQEYHIFLLFMMNFEKKRRAALGPNPV